MKSVLSFITLICLVIAADGQTNAVWLSQNGTGGGTSSSDLISWSNFNDNITFGSGANQLGAGSTLHIVGTVMNTISLNGGGSPGNPLTILFANNAVMSNPNWNLVGGGVAIFLSEIHDVIINGGTNGSINSTSNGTLLTYQVAQQGILVGDSSDITIENLAFSNLYVMANNTFNSVQTFGVTFNANNLTLRSNLLVTNCTFHDMYSGVTFNYGNFTNCGMVNCSGYNVNWGGSAGDDGSGSVMNGLLVQGNLFNGFSIWDDTGGNNHHNGFYLYAQSGGTATNYTLTGNSYGPGWGSHSTGGVFVSGNCFSGTISGNSFSGLDGTSPANGFLTVGINSISAASSVSMTGNHAAATNGNKAFDIGSAASYTVTYTVENNAVTGCNLGLFLIDNTNSTLVSDYNTWCGMLPAASSGGFNSSPNGNAGTYYDLPAWQGLGYDLHSTTNCGASGAVQIVGQSSGVSIIGGSTGPLIQGQ